MAPSRVSRDSSLVSWLKASPKSITTGSLPRLIMMLAGFKSRWTMPFSWAAANPSASLRMSIAAARCFSRFESEI